METRVRQRPQVIPGSVDFYKNGSAVPAYSVELKSRLDLHTATPVDVVADASQYIRDVFDPKYLDKKRQDELILRPVIQWKREMLDQYTDMYLGLGSYDVPMTIPNWGGLRYTGCLLAGAVPNYYDGSTRPFGYDDWVSNAQSLTLQKCIAKAKAADLCTGEFLGTLKQTLGMLRQPLSSSLDILHKIAVKKKKLMHAGFDGLTAGTSAWLEYRYGWAPLIGDLSKIAAELHKQREILLNKRLVARASMTTERVTNHVQEVALNGSYFLFDVSTMRSCKAIVRSQIFYRVKDKDQAEYIKKFMGLRLRDIPMALYELTPWSFVFDWFLAFGTWLEYVIPDPDVIVEGSCTSTKEWFEYNSTIVGSSYPSIQGYAPKCLYADKPPVMTDRYVQYEREVNRHTELQWPTSDGFGLSDLQSVDAFALTIAAIAKKIPAMVSR